MDIDPSKTADRAVTLIDDLLAEWDGNHPRQEVKKKKVNVEWYKIFGRHRSPRLFRQALHINRSTFFLLTQYLSVYGGEAAEEAKNMNVSFSTVVCRGILAFASSNTFADSAVAMHCSLTVLKKSVDLVTKMLLNIYPRIIRIPEKHLFRYFKTNTGEVFKGAVLAIGIISLFYLLIDGTHMRLSNEVQFGGMFLNRKKFASLNVLIVSDWNQNIVFADANWPGAACDITVWKRSALCKALCEDRDAILPSRFDINLISRIEGCFILSDKGYRCTEFNLSPFFLNEKEKDLTPEECHHFDVIHRITRSSIERAIGKLKKRVPALAKGIYKRTPEGAIDFVYASIAFHQLSRYIELALKPTNDYVKHMKTYATDIPDYVSESGAELRRKVARSIHHMREK